MYYPLRSLREGHWFKLICGASFQHLPAVRNLVLAYTLAGADCIDVAADPAVISTAKTALRTAAKVADDIREQIQPRYLPGLNQPELSAQRLPWLMASFNDGEDPHFRKAEFIAADCPSTCLRPCETICPAQAISFNSLHPFEGSQDSQVGVVEKSGVLDDRCYGCGRCLPVCPIQHISTRSYVSTPAAIAPLILQTEIDAIEIHTQVGHLNDFQRLWSAIAPGVHSLKLVAISCPDSEGLIDYLWSLYEVISPLPCALVWQTDGRPMSGDIGAGATRAAVRLGQKVLAEKLPGYVQLAGGTNHHTVPKLASLGLLNANRSQSFVTERTVPPLQPYIAGVAYGSYARALLLPIFAQLEAMDAVSAPEKMLSASPALPTLEGPFNSGQPLRSVHLEDHPDLLWQAVSLARSLISPLKSFPVNPSAF